MTKITKTRDRSRKFATALLLAASCLLPLGAVACGPSEHEIEATIAARIAEQPGPAPTAQPVPLQESDATATAVAQMPTATVAVQSSSGLILPTRLVIDAIPYEMLSAEEARRRYRDVGCMGCSTQLADSLAERVEGDLVDHMVLMAHISDDNLPDAILLTAELENPRSDPGRVPYYAYPFVSTGIGLDLAVRSWATGYIYGHLQISFYRLEEGRYGNREEKENAIRRNFGALDHSLFRVPGNDVVYHIVQNRRYNIISVYALLSGEGSLRRYTLAQDYWVGDFDDDGKVEIEILSEDNSIIVLDISEYIGYNEDATDTVTLAIKDFAGNLLTDDAADFDALWREHGPSASVAALALILDMPFPELLYDLYAAVNKGEDIRETVLEIRESRR